MTSSHLRVLHNRHRPLYETVSFWLPAYDAFWGHLWIIFTNSNLGYILPKQALHQYWNTNNNHDWNQTSKWKDNGKTWQVKHVREAVIRLEWFWIPHSTCCCCYTFPLLLSPSENETSSKRKKIFRCCSSPSCYQQKNQVKLLPNTVLEQRCFRSWTLGGRFIILRQ